MVAVIIKGNEVAEKTSTIKRRSCEVERARDCTGLAVILVGEDPASRSYVKGKEKGCEQVGIYSELMNFLKQLRRSVCLLKSIA